MPETKDERACRTLLAIIRALVDRVDVVIVVAGEAANGVVFRVQVDSTDVGKVIGKQGRNARAIRQIMTEIGLNFKRSYTLDIQQTAPRST